MPAVRGLCAVLYRWLIVAVLAAVLTLGVAAQPAAAAGVNGVRGAAAHHQSATHRKRKHRKHKKHKKHKHHKHHKKSKSKPTSNVAPKPDVTPPSPTAGATPTSTTPAASGSPASSGPAPSVVTPALVTHLLAQQGLLVGMASNVLQNQLLLDLGAVESVGSCDTLDGGGSTQVTGSTHPSASETDETRVVYYDAACTHPYISSTAKLVTSSTGSALTATAVYTAMNGTDLGTLRTEAHTIDGANDIQLAGLGTFVSATGSAGPVSLGLTCDAPTGSSQVVPPFPCEGGVMQDFPGLGRALGSLTPLTMTVDTSGGGPALTFSGSAATMEIGSLALTLTPANALAISGTPIATLADSVSGQAAAFSLFPPTPTGWSATDLLDGQSFQINVADNTTRNLSGGITAPGGAAPSYATFSLDQSGTGTISYGGGPAVSVTSWILGG